MATITAWRLVKPEYAATAYSGEGARRFGGRWNPMGYSMAYASESRALAALEMLVHLRELRLIESLMLVPCRFDSAEMEVLETAEIPRDWKVRHGDAVTQDFGARWIENASSAVLAVPSVVVPAEKNYLFNPGHPRFGECKVGRAEGFEFDSRLSA
ncbi:MAG: RES family NAD+ phosphorylase [Verrucomicrobiota bacterium]